MFSESHLPFLFQGFAKLTFGKRSVILYADEEMLLWRAPRSILRPYSSSVCRNGFLFVQCSSDTVDPFP